MIQLSSYHLDIYRRKQNDFRSHEFAWFNNKYGTMDVGSLQKIVLTIKVSHLWDHQPHAPNALTALFYYGDITVCFCECFIKKLPKVQLFSYCLHNACYGFRCYCE